MELEMENATWACICKQENPPRDPFNLLKCSKCGDESHSNCYEVYNQEAKKNFHCLNCRIIENNPYFQMEQSLIKPICFYSSDTINKDIQFEISPTMLSTIREQRTHSLIVVFTKVIYEPPRYIEYPANTELTMTLNKKPLKLCSQREVALQNFLAEGRNTLSVTSSKLPAKCILGIFYGPKVDTKQIVKIILKSDTQPSIEESKKNFESVIFKEIEILAAFPVIDPITNKMMKFPARGLKCRHLQCFDLVNFLKFYQEPKEKSWQCFCCKNIIPWKEIILDQYVYTIIKEINSKYDPEKLEEIENICFDEEGNWMLQEDYVKQWESNFASTREKRNKEKRDKMVIEKESASATISKEIHEDKAIRIEEEKRRSHQSELSVEELVKSFNEFKIQFLYNTSPEEINEVIASQMKDNKMFRFFEPKKLYEFFEKTLMTLGLGLPVIFTESDDKIPFYSLDELAQMVYKKKLNAVLPYIFAWARTYDDLIVITLNLITKCKREEPNLALAIELLLCFSWRMESRKITFDGLFKQTMYQLFGKLLFHFGEKLQWRREQYETLMIVFKRYTPNLYVPSTIPKKFGYESEKIFQNQSDFIVNMTKSLTKNELIEFLRKIHKPPTQEIIDEAEEKILVYVFYYFNLIFRKFSPEITNEEIWLSFQRWDQNKYATSNLKSRKIEVYNLTAQLENL